MKKIAERVVTLRKSLGMTQEQFAKYLGNTRGYVSHVEMGKKSPGPNFVEKIEIAERRGNASRLIDTSAIYGEKSNVEAINLPPEREIPIFTLVPGGAPVDFEVLPEHWQDKTTYRGRDDKAFALRLTGDSMMPEFPPGTILTVSPSHPPDNGDHVIATIKNEGSLFKRFYVSGDHRIVTLTSYNESIYPPIVRPREHFHSIYRVVESTLKRKL